MNQPQATEFVDEKKPLADEPDAHSTAIPVQHSNDTSPPPPHHHHSQPEKWDPSKAAPSLPTPHPIVRFFRTHFELQEGIGLGHTLTFCMAVMFTICAFVLVNAQQANILVDRFDVSRADKGRITGILVIADEALSVLLIALWGFFSDLLGRRILYAIGFLITAAGMIIIPHATCIFGPAFFSSLLFFRLLFSIGCSIIASLMVAVLSDTATDKSRGRFSALVGMFSGLGAVLGALFFPKLPVWFKVARGSMAFYQCSYYAMAACLCITAALVLIFLSSGPKASHVLHRCTTQNVKKQVKDALLATCDPMVALAYFSGFTARSITSINTAYYTLWVTESFQRLGLCSRAREQPCGAGYSHGHVLHGILQVTSLVFAPVYGYLAHRVSSRLAIMISCACFTVAYIIMIIVQSANSKWQYLVSILAGTGQIGIVISGLSLVVAHSPVHLRGAISGAYSLFGAVGILLNSEIAGVLFDAWTPIAPFMVLFFWIVLLFVATIVFPRLGSSTIKQEALLPQSQFESESESEFKSKLSTAPLDSSQQA